MTNPDRKKHAPKGGIPEEILQELLEEGIRVREMARRLSVVPNTVRYWLRRYGLPTKIAPVGKPRVHGRAGDNGPTIESVCGKHGRTIFGRRSDGGYRCRRCAVEAVARRRRKVRARLVAEAGGACALCGFDRTPAALSFHHVDPATKMFGLSERGLTRSIDKLRKEAAKCILLCANCHAAVESGTEAIPAEILRAKLRSIAA